MKMTRCATLLAKPISCVTTIMVMPSRARSTMTSSTSEIISGSSAEVGSSNSIAIGSIAIVRAAQNLLLREAQVLDDTQMRKQFEMLEHHADPGAQLRQVGLGIVHLDA